jgi:NAD(P)-dependent dehydrogenase (short-subunit alcohol dehydrogenase family)
MATGLPLSGQVALVAGATRGAGRGIARALGEAGALVYCTGRSAVDAVKGMDRPETIDETAALIEQAGGRAIAVRVDHTREEEVAKVVARVRSEAGRLDVLVNSIWGADPMIDWSRRFWEVDLANVRAYLDQTLIIHMITCRHVAPLMVEANRGLIIEVIDGHFAGYRGGILYDLVNGRVPDFPRLFDVKVKEIASTPLDDEGLFLLWARYCQIHRDPAGRDLALQLANALGLENLGPVLAPAATPA